MKLKFLIYILFLGRLKDINEIYIKNKNKNKCKDFLPPLPSPFPLKKNGRKIMILQVYKDVHIMIIISEWYFIVYVK